MESQYTELTLVELGDEFGDFIVDLAFLLSIQ